MVSIPVTTNIVPINKFKVRNSFKNILALIMVKMGSMVVVAPTVLASSNRNAFPNIK